MDGIGKREEAEIDSPVYGLATVGIVILMRMGFCDGFLFMTG